MNLYQLPTAPLFSGLAFKFSWIAFDPENPMKRVLFDCHPPKGPHFHLDGDLDGQPFAWVTLEESVALFRKKVEEHFGKLVAVPDEGDLR